MIKGNRGVQGRKGRGGKEGRGGSWTRGAAGGGAEGSGAAGAAGGRTVERQGLHTFLKQKMILLHARRPQSSFNHVVVRRLVIPCRDAVDFVQEAEDGNTNKRTTLSSDLGVLPERIDGEGGRTKEEERKEEGAKEAGKKHRQKNSQPRLILHLHPPLRQHLLNNPIRPQLPNILPTPRNHTHRLLHTLVPAPLSLPSLPVPFLLSCST